MNDENQESDAQAVEAPAQEPAKAYSLSGLAEAMKARGLDLAEDACKQALNGICDWLESSAKISDTPYDDMAMSLALPKIKEMLLAQIDKIDGSEG